MTSKAQIQALKLLGQSAAQIGQALGIAPRTVRYHLRRLGREDRRKNRRRKLDALAPAIEHWVLARYPLAGRGLSEGPAYLRPLHDWLRREHGYGGSHRSVVRHVRRAFPGLRLRPYSRPGAPVDADARADEFGPAWVLRLLLGKVSLAALRGRVGEVGDLELLYRAVREGGCKRRKKALVVLGFLRQAPAQTIVRTLGLSRRTMVRYWETYRAKGAKKLLDRLTYKGGKARDERIRSAVVSLLHSPPQVHNINRTSWKMDDLRAVLKGQGLSLSAGTVRKIFRVSGFKWRKARTVLTSNDPRYKEKVEKVTFVLSNLRPEERFFSIDEFGPFAVKMRGGRLLCGPKEMPTVPQYQKAKGSLLVTAALELSTNQVTHLYSAKKDTEEMVKLLGALLVRYADCERIYLSWDAASWHDSNRLHERVAEVNAETRRQGRRAPLVELVPLPSRAQFLNVIESVFSGMARAIIHNSDYQSVEEAKEAIDRYFRERNDYFTRHPKKAGRKIWGKERVPCRFSEGNNCKDPRWCH